ncbi:MAG: hypothetical protein QOJ45_1914 [Verrucomicrobiota bacterium]|jgi:hypothetical protein
MNAPVVCLFLVTCFSLNARGDLTIVQKVEGKNPASDIVLKLKGDKARIEATPQFTSILDGKTGETITLMNAQKKFLRISGEKAKAIAEMANKYTGATPGQPKMAATGKKMSINGYDTEEYVWETPNFKARYWIAPTYPDGGAILKQLQAAIPTIWNDVAKGMLNYHDLPGLPLRTQIKAGENEITTTVVSIKQDPLSDADFVVPKDFAEMRIPNVPGILSEKPAPPPASSPKP